MTSWGWALPSSVQDHTSLASKSLGRDMVRIAVKSDQVKCKTKLIAFLRRPRELPSLLLCGVELHWLDKIKHLGNNITNTMEGNQFDISVKSTMYINKCNSLSQEYYLTHPITKVHINTTYNSHFTGSQLWDINSKEMEKLESTYNKSIKLMFGLLFQPHRYLVEPLTRLPHLRKLLFRRYLTFIAAIEASKKNISKEIVKTVKDWCKNNDRKELEISDDSNSVETIREEDIDTMEYNTSPEDDQCTQTVQYRHRTTYSSVILLVSWYLIRSTDFMLQGQPCSRDMSRFWRSHHNLKKI